MVTEATANNGLATNSHTFTTTLPGAEVQYDQLSVFLYGLERWLPVLVTVYVIGVVFLLLRFCLNLFNVSRLRRINVTPANAGLYAKLHQWQEQLGINKKVQLLDTAKADVPMMIGMIKPIS